MTAPLIDLDAAKREARYPDGIPVALGGQTFTLPAELPVATFDPLLSDELDLVGVVSKVLADEASTKSVIDQVIDVLTDRPDLPTAVLAAIHGCFRILFGPEQYETFAAQRPSVQDYVRLVKALVSLYGVNLGEAFASAGSSESDGQTPKPTSQSTTDSTPEVSGDSQDSPAS